jgi:RNA polymerase sigma-70 factor (ECF subfamily)
VLVLRYSRDLTVDQVAALLGIPAGTVKSRIHHALKALRAALESPIARTVKATEEDR